MKYMMKLLSTILLLIYISNAFAFDVTNTFSGNNLISQEVSFWKTDKEEVDIKNAAFVENKKKAVSFSYTNDTIWLSINLNNKTAVAKEVVLYIDSALAGEVKLYQNYDGNLNYLGVTGSKIVYNQRHIPATVAAFKVLLSAQSENRFLLRRIGGHRLDGRVFVSDMETFKKQERNKDVIIFFYVGVVMALLIYNFFVGIYTRRQDYYYYTAFIFFIAGTALNLIGGLDRIFSNSWPLSNILLMFSAGSVSTAMAFSYRFVSAGSYYPKFKYVYLPLFYSGLIHFFLYPVLKPFIGGYMGVTIDITLLAAILSMLTIGILTMLKDNRISRFYVASWGVLLCSAISWFGMTFGVLPQSNFTKYSLLWGNILEMLILSLGLAYRIVILDREKKRAELRVKEQERYRLLLRVVIHDIANPLTVVKSYLQLMGKKLNNGFDKEKFNSFLEKSDRATSVMEDIIDSVKKQESSINKEMKNILKPVCLKDVIENSYFIFQKRAEDKGVKINLPENYYTVMADKTLLMNNVISNILSNAIKFSPKGSQIDIFCNKDDYGSVEVIVRDYGKGLSDEQIQEFYNRGRLASQNGTDGETGTGYGMMLIKTYMEAFSGDFLISNATNEFGEGQQGAVIKLRLKSA